MPSSGMGSELDEAESRMVANLDSALEKLPKVKGTVYRTLNFDDVFDPEAEFNAFIEQHAEGTVVGYDAYTSASTKADGYPLASGTKCGVVMEIFSENARNLEGFGNNFESEALFPRGTDFVILSVRTGQNGYTHIVMEEAEANAERNEPEHDTQKRSKTMQQVQKKGELHRDLPQVSEENTARGPDGRGMPGVPAEVTSEPATTEAQIEQKAELGNQEAPKGENFVIPAKGGVKVPTTPKARFKANTDAIKTLRTIMAEGRTATPKEQETLAKYTGWGGLTNAFNEKDADWAKEYQQLKKLLDEGQYKAAKSSILDAYYTDPAVIQGMYHGLAKLGFHGGRLLEPSAGVGRFLGAMPQEMRSGVQSWTAVELDKLTGNIAKFLYPNADVRVQGYETT